MITKLRLAGRIAFMRLARPPPNLNSKFKSTQNLSPYECANTRRANPGTPFELSVLATPKAEGRVMPSYQSRMPPAMKGGGSYGEN